MAVSLTRNVIANAAGQGWRAAMNFAFIPLYIKYLGIETYGLIGIFALLQAWLVLLDMGMKPALGREMARFTAGAHDARSIRDLLRTVEVIGIALAGTLALGIWAASNWLASDWLRVENLPTELVARAFTAMGVVTALRFLEGIYVSCLAGLELQVRQNVVVSIMATARGLGAVGVLAWISPTVEAFFVWQGLISLLSVALFAGLVYRALPPSARRARFSAAALADIWHFAAGMLTITGLTLLLTQVDKILLSRLLKLEAYGYYALAVAVANGLSLLVTPITAAFYPRFTGLAALQDESALRAAYHQAAQLVAVLTGSAAAVLIVFREQVILVWTGDPILVDHAASVMAVLALGTLLNGLMSIPYQMMLAHGWTTLMIKASVVAVAILVPAILWTVPHYGAIGAAWIWVALNAGFVMLTVPLMHRRLLREELLRWYRQDLAMPLAAATGVALLCVWLVPGHLSRIGEFSMLLIISACVLLASTLAAPAIRSQLFRYVANMFKSPVAGSAPNTRLSKIATTKE
jgi:O-antigen/teichoic acid export membrane protein